MNYYIKKEKVHVVENLKLKIKKLINWNNNEFIIHLVNAIKTENNIDEFIWIYGDKFAYSNKSKYLRTNSKTI